MTIKLTFDFLPVAAVLLSLLALYVPKFNRWYQGLSSEHKQAFMALALLISAFGASLLSWLGLLAVYPVSEGWRGLIWYPLVDFTIALIANSGTYKATNKLLAPKS